MRKNFYDIINNAEFNPQKEFERIKFLFTTPYEFVGYSETHSLSDLISIHFNIYPESIKKRTLNFNDFNSTYGFDIIDIDKYISGKCIENDDLILYCEYIKTLICILDKIIERISDITEQGKGPCYKIKELTKLINSSMEELCLMPIQNGDFQLFTPKDAAVVSASEIVPEEIVIPILEYHHHSLKGNIDKKRTILLKLADDLEPKRKDLKSINSTLEDNLFYLFNNINIRHNNTNPNDKSKYKAYVANLSQNELEDWYDETYQLCLLAFLELDNVERNNKIKQLKQDISNTK